jgi:hypothetical protein
MGLQSIWVDREEERGEERGGGGTASGAEIGDLGEWFRRTVSLCSSVS